MKNVRFRPAAEADLAAIALYIAEDSVDRALDVIDRLRARCEVLSNYPQAGPLRAELGEGLRSLSEPPYVVLYRVIDGVAEVVAVLHGARDLPMALQDRKTK